MQQGSDYTSYYPPHHVPVTPYPNPGELPTPNSIPLPAFASAPPYSHHSTPSPDYPQAYPPPYPSYPQTPDSGANPPPIAQSYAPPPPQSQPKIPSFQPYSTPPTFASEQYPPLHQQQPAPYYSYDTHQPPAPASYVPPNPTPSSYVPYEGQYDNVAGSGRFDHGSSGPYYNESPRRYGSSSGATLDQINTRFEQDFYERSGGGAGYGRIGAQDDIFGDGVYAYSGGRSEPYGARGTKSSSFSAFDDYGRSTSFSSSQKEEQSVNFGKIVKAVPKVETDDDAKSGVFKFRVKLLSESGGQGTLDVICQIGLDGIRMLDPSTKRTLRIYPLETVTRWEINSADSSIYQFWAKSPVDIEPRRIRLQSNKYTASTILDIVAASTVQLKEMGGTDESGIGKGTSDSSGSSGQPPEKKKGLVDWMNLIKPPNEEKDHWVPDMVVSKCTSCGADFGAFLRRHHCRNCGDIFCDKCTSGRIALTADEQAQPVRVCDRCMAEVTRRLNIAKESANKPVGLRTHEDLARKLQEELDKKCKISSGKRSSNGSGSGRRMREVACPTCTVHLQVQVPTSGSETIECGVCQHPFLVSAR